MRFLCSQHEQIIENTTKLLVIWDPVMLMWRHSTAQFQMYSWICKLNEIVDNLKLSALLVRRIPSTKGQ